MTYEMGTKYWRNGAMATVVTMEVFQAAHPCHRWIIPAPERDIYLTTENCELCPDHVIPEGS